MTMARFETGMAVMCDDHRLTQLAPALDEAQELGVDWAELPLDTMNVIAGGRIVPSQRDRLKAIAAGRPIRLSTHSTIALNFMADPGHLPLHLDVARACVDLSAEIGARRMVIHTGSVVSRDPSVIAQAYDRQREAMRRLGDHAAAAGVLVCVENIFPATDDHHTASPAMLARELEAIAHPAIRGTFDFSHGFINCSHSGRDFPSEAEALAPFAAHLHIHDSFGRPRTFRVHSESEALAFGIGDLHLPPGWGEMNWDVLLERLAFPADAVFMLELDKRFWPEIADAVAATRALANRARPLDPAERVA